MTDIASGRAMSLQDKIIKAIIRAHDIDSLSDGGIKHIFKDLLDDPTIRAKYMEALAIGPFKVGIDPYDVEITTASNLKDNEMMIVHPDGRTEAVVFEWDDVEKKNKVIVKKVK